MDRNLSLTTPGYDFSKHRSILLCPERAVKMTVDSEARDR